MGRYLIGLFLSFLLSNWCYSELALVIPGFDGFCRKIYTQVRLPTHDEWPEIFNNSESSVLKDRVVSALENLPQGSNLAKLTSYFGITDPGVMSIRNTLREAEQSTGEMIRLFQS